MSKVKIKGNASGTGVLTIEAPNTNTDSTITLPDGDVTLGVGIDDNATSTAITIGSDENVGVGTSSPQTILSLDENTDAIIGLNRETSGGNGGDLQVRAGAGRGSGNSGGDLYLCSGTGTSSASVGKIQFGRSSGDDSTMPPDEIWTTIDSTGNVKVNTGNLVIGTSGKGIDFSATSDGSGTMTSEVLDDYEEGTFTATLTASNTVPTNPCTCTGYYTKIGNKVHFNIQRFEGVDTTGAQGQMKITGLPFAMAKEFWVMPFTHGFNFNTSYIPALRGQAATELRGYEMRNGTSWNQWYITAGSTKYLTTQGSYETNS